MELKDYLRIFWRRKLVFAITLVAVLAGFYGASKFQKNPFMASIDVHFKQTPLELGYFSPEDYTYPFTSMAARIYLFKNPAVLEGAVQRLKDLPPDKRIDCSTQQLEDWVAVSESGAEKIAVIRAVHSDPRAPPLLARAMFDSYIAYMKTENDKAFKNAQNRVAESLEEAKSSLDKAVKEQEDKINELFASKGIANPQLQGKIKSEIIVELERMRQQNLIELRKTQDRLDKIPEGELRLAQDDLLWRHGPPFSAAAPRDSGITTKLRDLNLRLNQLRKKYREEHPEIIALKDDILYLQGEISAEIQRPSVEKTASLLEQKEALLSSNALLQDILESEFKQLRDLQIGEAELGPVQKRIEEETAREAKLRDRQVTLVQASDRSNSMTDQSIVAVREMKQSQEAPLPGRGTSPQIAFAVSIIVSGLVAFLVDYLSDSIRTANDVKVHMNLPTIAWLPDLKSEPHNLLTFAIKSPIYEVYNKLATFLEAEAATQKAKTILVTSTKPGEGKTTVSSNLAIALAQGGSRITLVDADLRKPSVHQFFGLDNSKGLTDLLSAETEPTAEGASPLSVDDYLQTTQIPNLRVLTSGSPPVNPVGLLKSDRTKWLVEELSTRSDLSVFDSPPHLGVIDSVVLAGLLDLTVVVLAEGEVRRGEIANLKHAMRQVGANVIGVIINRSRSQIDAYYYYYYQYHRYSA